MRTVATFYFYPVHYVLQCKPQKILSLHDNFFIATQFFIWNHYWDLAPQRQNQTLPMIIIQTLCISKIVKRHHSNNISIIDVANVFLFLSNKKRVFLCFLFSTFLFYCVFQRLLKYGISIISRPWVRQAVN